MAVEPARIFAEEFVDWLFGVENPTIDGRAPNQRIKVEGPVTLAGRSDRVSSEPIRRRRMENFDFTADIDLSGARFRFGIEWANCSAPDVKILLAETQVKGSLRIDAEGTRLRPSEIRLSGSRIDGSVSIGGEHGQLSSATVSLNGARIGGNLSLRNATIRRRLDLSNVRVGGKIDLGRTAGPGKSLTIGLDQPGGLATATAPVVTKVLVASNAVVEGDFTITGATIRVPSGNDAIDLMSATIGGQLTFAPLLSREEEIAIDGDIEIVGNVEATNLRCRGGCELKAVSINGYLNLSLSHLSSLWAGPVGSTRVRIAGDLHLSAIRSHPWIRLDAISIGGDCKVLGSEINTFQITIGWLSETFGYTIAPSSVGRLLIKSTDVRGDLVLPFIQVDGTRHDADRQGAVIEGATIEGSLEFWSPWRIRDLWLKKKPSDETSATCQIYPWRHSAAIVGDIRIEDSTVRGNLNLSFAKTTGRIDLAGSRVSGDVLFSSTQTASAGFTDQAEKNKAEDAEAHDPLVRASASEVVLRMLRVDNDLDLTGLSLFYNSDEENPRREQSGAIDATHLAVKGKIKAHDKRKDREDKTYVEVPGKFDLSNVQTVELEISGDSFPANNVAPQGNNPKDRYQNGIVLSGGNIGTLRIPEIQPGKRTRPFPVALADLTVRSWDISGGADDVRPYLNLLAKDPVFQRSNYTVIETYLRNRGDEHHAIKIYRKMWQAERAELSRNLQLPQWEWPHRKWAQWPRLGRFFSWVKLCVYGPLLGFGTNLWPLSGLILTVAVVAYPLYRHPANIEPSLARLAGHTARDGSHVAMHGEPPEPSAWTIADAIGMEVRYHIPVADLIVRDEWTMRTKPPAIYDPAALLPFHDFPPCMPGHVPEPVAAADPHAPPSGQDQPPPSRGPDRCASRWAVVLPFAAEDAAVGFSILNYIMWPFLIAFLVRKVLRTREE